MANEITTKNSGFISAMNDSVIKAQLIRSLKDDSGAFMSSMIDLYESDKGLQECNPKAVVAECVKAAALKLPIVKSLGFAYVVAYKKVPTFVIGYKGLIQLAQRTGLFRYINADIVYEGELVGKDKITGMIDLSGERKSDKVIGYFAYFCLNNGFEKMFYMTKAECEEWGKRYSPSYSSSYSPWQKEFDKMAMKTCLRRLFTTYAPMSTEMQQAVAYDDVDSSVAKEIAANANSVVIEATPAEVVADAETGEVKAEPNF